jgi:polyphosphate kinase
VSTPASVARDLPRYAEDLAEELEDQRHVASRLDRPSDPDRFIDRERSWLDFNARVLELAEDPTTPALERARFIAIFADNLDEFFMVRVAGLQRRIATGLGVASPAGLSAREQVELISGRAHELALRHGELFRGQILPALRDAGIEVVMYADLRADERASADALFDEHIFPVLTPLAVDPAHPFPYISGLSLNLAVVVRDRETGREHFARVKVPQSLPRFISVGEQRFVLIEQVIAAHLPSLFPGMDVTEASLFRVTRNEDLTVDEDDVDNLLQALERELTRRRFGPAVRLEVEADIAPRVLDLLVRELDISEQQLYRIKGMLDLAGLWPIVDLDLPALKNEIFPPVTHPRLRSSGDATNPVDVFGAMRDRDVLLHHPYVSFATSVQAFVEQAATDPAVLAIKQTLYRTSGDSPIVDALVDAAEAGKQVLVVVEITARFDEQANIKWARALEHAGCHVVYGVVGLKTHCKLALVVRQEPDGSLRRYAHIGTGNYNPKTARLYEDIGLLTVDEVVTADVADLFNHLSGYTKHREYHSLLVAPDTLRSGLVSRISREADNARDGRPAGITMKLNSLVDELIIDALYDASAAGVPIDLVIRGMCCLRPGIDGLSDNIRVRSILGRFLEHSRIFRFCNDGADELLIGSADAMHRNLDRRVEALVEIRDPEVRAELQQLLDLAVDPATSAWHLGADGSWQRRTTNDAGDRLHDFQLTLLRTTAARVAELHAESHA